MDHKERGVFLTLAIIAANFEETVNEVKTI